MRIPERFSFDWVWPATFNINILDAAFNHNGILLCQFFIHKLLDFARIVLKVVVRHIRSLELKLWAWPND